MTDEATRNLLKTLHSALNGATTITEKDRALLEQLSVDIEALLAQPGAIPRAEHQSLVNRLQVAVTRFEVSHPDLAAAMLLASKRLADMGI